MNRNLAPIALFIYNRPWHTKQTLLALQKNDLADESILYIFADGAKGNSSPSQLKSIQEARALIHSKKWCKEVHIIQQEKNKGLADSIVDGVSEVIEKHGKVIVLEDDLVTSKGFLRYMNDALDLYESEEKVMHISGYMFPVKEENLPEVFFFNTATPWSWATWKRAWNKYDPKLQERYQNLIASPPSLRKFNVGDNDNFSSQIILNLSGERKTWAIRWYLSIFFENGFCLHPRTSLVQNIGTDGTGENFQHSTSEFKIDRLVAEVNVTKIPLKENSQVIRLMEEFYKENTWNKSWFRKLSEKIMPELSIRLLKEFMTYTFSRESIEINRISKMPRFIVGKAHFPKHFINGWHFLDSGEFLNQYQNAFLFGNLKTDEDIQAPTILEIGSNVGVNIAFYKERHPSSLIWAFEEMLDKFNITKKNIEINQLEGVTLINSKFTIEKISSIGNSQLELVSVCDKKIDVSEIEILVTKLSENTNSFFIHRSLTLNSFGLLERIIQFLESFNYRVHVEGLSTPANFHKPLGLNNNKFDLIIIGKKERHG